jgi:phospholipid/cholesterol/gamma-HCH transport system substrate-binding protein
MDNNANYTLVGAFVITLIAAIVFAIIWLSSGLSAIDYKNYIIYSQESVSGLSIDAPVEYNGVKVGSVEKVTLDDNNPHLVKVTLKIDSTTPVSQGTVATLTSRGVTGVAFIALKDVGNNLQPLIVQPGQRYPVIPTSPSIFMRLDTALTNLNKSVQTVSESIRGLLDKDNLKSIKGVLANLNHVTATLSENSQKLTTIMANTSRASEQLIPLIHHSSTAMKTLELQTLPATYQLLSTLNDVARTLNEVTTQLKQNPSMLIRGVAPLPPGPGEKR